MKTTFLLILTIALFSLYNTPSGGPSPVQITAQERVPLGVEKMSVVEVYRMFQGREPKHTKTLRVPQSARLPAKVAQLGKLREIIGGFVDGKFTVQLPWSSKDGALLLSTAQGVMYACDPFGSLRSLPRVMGVVYETNKGQGNHVYEHRFTRATRLTVIPNSKDKFARFSGAYKIDARGILG